MQKSCKDRCCGGRPGCLPPVIPAWGEMRLRIDRSFVSEFTVFDCVNNS